jgi:hypothetical protein
MTVVPRFMAMPVNDNARSAQVLYPLNEVIFPRNVWPPHVQWQGPAMMGDLYRVRVMGGPVTITAYTAHSGAGFTYSFQLPASEWNSVTLASPGRELSLVVDRWDSTRNEVIAGSPIRMRIARGSIAGAVYYWTLGNFGGTEGRILRLIQGAERAPSPDNFMPSPPPRANGQRCAACHNLSRDGSRLAVSLGDGDFGGVFDATRDLRAVDPPMQFRFAQSWMYASFSPNGARIWMTDASQRSFLLDGNTGASVTPASGPLTNSTHPAWAPDNNSLVAILNANDAWDLNRGDLGKFAITGADRFAAPTILHRGAELAGAPEGGVMDAYPTISPDSRWIAFEHGTGVITSRAATRGALYVMPIAGAPPIRLTRASTGRQDGDAFYPTFTPFFAEGMDGGISGQFERVYWLLHYTHRDYGNTQAGTRGTGRRQIWVSAITAEPRAGTDPSAVPYWLPGQDIAQENASAQWAPYACRSNDVDCHSDSECCSSNCQGSRCRPPDGRNNDGGMPGGCRMDGQSCTISADCCNANVQCVGGLCVPIPP